jgi:hypothetical protein
MLVERGVEALINSPAEVRITWPVIKQPILSI